MNPASDRPHHWVPNTNVFISDSGDLIIQVELSDLQKDDIEITREGNTLQMVGHRRNAEFASAKTILVHEMHSGPFESKLELPPGFDLARSTSAYQNGLLRIEIPKEDTSQPFQFPPRN